MTVLTDRVNFAEDVKDVRQQWMRDLFLYMGLDVDGMDKAPRDAVVQYFIENDIEVIEHMGIDAVEIRHKGDVIAEWGGPEFKMREDPVSGELYFEAEIEFWSIMEEEIDSK